MITGLAEMRMVRYTLDPEKDIDPKIREKGTVPEGRSVSAMIVRIVDEEKGVVSLTLFPDWADDGFVIRSSAVPQPCGIVSRKNVEHSTEGKPGTWDFPAFAKGKKG